nr:hypothetical protein [Bacteroidales bacterium]
MKLIQKINHIAAEMGHKLVLVIAFIFANLFFVRAQEPALRIYYHFDSAVVDADYLSNAETFQAMENMISSGASLSFEIVAYSSPEGNSAYNEDLSARRAEALRRHLVSRYPNLSGKLTLSPVAEAWDLLRSDVLNDTRLSGSARENILSIIDSNESDDAKEAKLSAM